MGYYVLLGISCFIIGVLTGLLIVLLIRRRPTSSTSSNPAVYPTPSGDLIKEVIEEEVDRRGEVNELNKEADKAAEDINKYLDKETP